ncbi:MAG: substrate-binding domain-containing protein [Chloroflexi bacterium]|nr:substrate-binding domain-containing protein [Chloroflexota bacterium]MYC02787.1 substrate-binding domain-containing protein [Chloroflexota bacterium]
MRSITWLGLGILIGALALGAVWAGRAGEGEADVRISVTRLNDGRVEVGLQQRGADGAWGETWNPRHRFLSADAEIGKPRFSEAIGVDAPTRREQVANEYATYLFSSGEGAADLFASILGRMAGDGDALPDILCVEDRNDAGIERLCDGLVSRYPGVVERVVGTDYQQLRAQLDTRLTESGNVGGALSSSIPAALQTQQALRAAGVEGPAAYWLELIDPHLAAADNFYCVISHGPPGDFFWGLSAESSVAAAGVLGIEVRSESHGTASEQAAAIGRCVDDGAAAIATTLAEPDVLRPAVAQAQAAGIPVISYNSGAEAAAEVGTALHISLDDREAGRMAGDAFNERGVSGNLLCIIHEPNNIGLLERCDGLEERFNGTVERWSPDGESSVLSQLQARLSSGDVDAAITLSTSMGAVLSRVLHISERELPAATFGWCLCFVEQVAEGGLLFAILDHPELQSYLATMAAYMVERLRIDPAAYFNSARLVITPTVADAELMRSMLRALTPGEPQP